MGKKPTLREREIAAAEMVARAQRRSPWVLGGAAVIAAAIGGSVALLTHMGSSVDDAKQCRQKQSIHFAVGAEALLMDFGVRMGEKE